MSRSKDDSTTMLCTARWDIRNGAPARCVPSNMARHKVYNEPTEVTAEDGEVILDGPDAVDVKVTPEAAEETADNLVDGAIEARGQRRLKDLPHKAR